MNNLSTTDKAPRQASQVNLAGLINDPEQRVFLLTTPSGEDGGGASAMTLASELSQLTGKQTLLIDAGSGKNSLTEFLGQAAKKGLKDIDLNNKQSAQASDFVVEFSHKKYAFLPAGQGAGSNTQAVYKQLEETLKSLKDTYHYIVLNVDSVYAKNSAVDFCRLVDAVVLVLKAEETRWEVAGAAKKRLEEAGATIAGCVLNERKYYTPGWIYNKL